MAMGNRPEVQTAAPPVVALDVALGVEQMATALARVPFRHPFTGPSSPLSNFGMSVTREVIRAFMGYSSALRIPEFRSVELLIDDICKVIMPPFVHSLDVSCHQTELGGVPGILYRQRQQPPLGVILYLHGGGYIGTSPRMYGLFVAWLCRLTGCEIFVADLRLAPEFPFPAGLEDAALVLEGLLAGGADPSRLFVGGDSSGGGLAASLMYSMTHTHHRAIAGVLLFSPELDLLLDDPSISDNAAVDILPWNIPTSAYLHGRSPGSEPVSGAEQDVSGWPPTFVCFGGDEMFRDSISRFVDHLGKAGVDTVSLEEPGMFHVFPILMPWADASRHAYRSVAAFVHAHLPDAVSVGALGEVDESTGVAHMVNRTGTAGRAGTTSVPTVEES
jgi:acetyl esterase/lipase